MFQIKAVSAPDDFPVKPDPCIHLPALHPDPVAALCGAIRELDFHQRQKEFRSDPNHAEAHSALGILHVHIMAADQPDNCIYRRVVVAESFQDSAGHFRALIDMPVEVINALRIRCLAGRLADIMQQHCKTQHFVRADRLHGMQDMLPHRVTVMRIVLRAAHADIEFRKEILRKAEHVRVPQPLRMIRADRLLQLRADPFGADKREPRREPCDGFSCLLLNRVIQLRGKPESAHDPQCVL